MDYLTKRLTPKERVSFCTTINSNRINKNSIIYNNKLIIFIPRGCISKGLIYDLLNNISLFFKPSLLEKVINKTREKTSQEINKNFYPYKSHLLHYALTSLYALIKAKTFQKDQKS